MYFRTKNFVFFLFCALKFEFVRLFFSISKNVNLFLNHNEERFPMDLYNRNGNNKRKFSSSIERDDQSKRKNNQSMGCFRRCCTRKKHQITPNQKEKINKISNVSITHLARSPLFHETTFCQKVSESYDDPCLAFCVQYGPDTWENILKYSNKHEVNF
jgi:hypothetical protein